MGSITRPLDFSRFVSLSLPRGFDTVPFFDAALIGIFFAINSSVFVFAPGVSIELSSSRLPPQRLSSTVFVLTAGPNGLFFFEGSKISQSSLADALSDFIASRPGQESNPILLIKADASLSIGDLNRIMDAAAAAGFPYVHLAAEHAPSP